MESLPMSGGSSKTKGRRVWMGIKSEYERIVESLPCQSVSFAGHPRADICFDAECEHGDQPA